MTSQSIHEIVKARSNTLILRFNRDFAPPTVATRGIEALSRASFCNGGSIQPLSSRIIHSKIWRFPENHDSSLWVRPKARYRRHYKKFIESIYGAVIWDGFENYDVDHLFNRARSFDDQTLLRVEAVGKSINRQHGQFEKASSGSPYEQANGRGRRPMTFISVLKLASIPSPGLRDDTNSIQKITNFFIAQGWSHNDINDALKSLISKAIAR